MQVLFICMQILHTYISDFSGQEILFYWCPSVTYSFSQNWKISVLQYRQEYNTVNIHIHEHSAIYLDFAFHTVAGGLAQYLTGEL